MTRRNITENVLHDPDVKNYVMLDVTDSIHPLSPRVIDGVSMVPKEEYHISLAPISKITGDPDLQSKLVRDIEAHLSDKSSAISFGGLGDRYFMCERDGESTIIVEAHVVGLDSLRAVISNLVPDYDPTFPHVTLMKSENSPYGIGINFSNDLASLCRPIDMQRV